MSNLLLGPTLLIFLAAGIVMFFLIYYFITLNLLRRIKNFESKINHILKERNIELVSLINVAKKGYEDYFKDLISEYEKMQILFENLENITQKSEYYKKTNQLLKKFLKRAESHPNFSKLPEFLKLQKNIQSLETSIEEKRQRYNDLISIYNVWLSRFPMKIMNKIFRFKKLNFF
ncbi:MAG: LemA family protein [Candidatus Woesearchaeota archaeon]